MIKQTPRSMQLIFRHLNKKFALSHVSWGLSVVQDLGVASADVSTRGSQGERPGQWSRRAWVRRKSIKTPSHVATISLGLYEGPLLTIIHVYRGVKTGSKSTLQHIKRGSISP